MWSTARSFFHDTGCADRDFHAPTHPCYQRHLLLTSLPCARPCACTEPRRVAGRFVPRTTLFQPGAHHHRQDLQRRPPAGPRGARGRPQAAGHVHRVHRHPRLDALPVGDHRQRRRRGARRPRAPGRGDAPPRRLRRGLRRRPRHPDRQGAEDRPARGRGRGDQAARRRQVRRWVLQRIGRPPRGRPLGRQRAVGEDGHRRRPVPVPAGPLVPARHPRRVRRRWTEGDVRGEVGAHPQGQARRQGPVGHPDPVLAGPPDLHQGRQVRDRRADREGPADGLHRARTGAGRPRPARAGALRGEDPPRRRHLGVRRGAQPR